MKTVKEIFKNLVIAILLHIGPIIVIIIASLFSQFFIDEKHLGIIDAFIPIIFIIIGIYIYYKKLKQFEYEDKIDLTEEVGDFVNLIYLIILIIIVIIIINFSKIFQSDMAIIGFILLIVLLITNFYLVRLTEREFTEGAKRIFDLILILLSMPLLLIIYPSFLNFIWKDFKDSV